eukprot:11925029-Alexandrium_andersonii.AAC.1
MTDSEPMAHRLENVLVRVGIEGRAREGEANTPIARTCPERTQGLLVAVPVQLEIELKGEVQEDAEVRLRLAP